MPNYNDTFDATIVGFEVNGCWFCLPCYNVLPVRFADTIKVITLDRYLNNQSAQRCEKCGTQLITFKLERV